MRSTDEIVISKLKRITVVSIFFMFVQIFGGYYAHSIAILADAFHLLSDIFAYMISLFAVLMSHRQAANYLGFGYEKLQPLGALVNVAIIWVVTIQLFVEATSRIITKQVVQEPFYMFITSIFGLLCNLYIMRVLHSDEHASGHHNCSHAHHSHAKHKSDSLVITIGDCIEEQHQGCSHHHQQEPKKTQKQQQKCSHDHQQGHHQHEHQHEDNCQHQQHSHHTNQPQQNQHKGSHGHEGHCCDSQSSSSLPSKNETASIIKSHCQADSDDNCVASEEDMNIPKQHHFENINIEAAYIHILTDIILSIGVILSASIIYFGAPPGWTYWQLADPLCTYLFSFMAIYSTIPITKESFLLLLDGCERPQLVGLVENDLRTNKAVQSYSDLRIWSTNRGKHYGAVRVKAFKLSSIQRQKIHRIFSSKQIQSYVEISEHEENV